HGEPLEGAWFNRSKEWSAKHRGLDHGRYDFATRYLVGLAPLPAFRHLEPEEYRGKVAELIREIEQEGEARRDGHPVVGVEKILSQNPYEPPTRQTKRSTKPRFHAASKAPRLDLEAELAAFLAEYWGASQALRSGNLKAAGWFPEGCYLPALAFTGTASQRRPPLPPTRRLEILDSGAIERGAIPIVTIVPAVGIAEILPRARGQPPEPWETGVGPGQVARVVEQ
ncbi:MAG: hypothetical protein AAF657_38235, partial [Acidobacteriota bacterium]